MDIQIAKQKFFKENPKAFAHFVYNEKLNKFLCFTFDYGIFSQGEISSEEIKKIEEFGARKNDEPLNTIIEYYSCFGINQSLLEKLSDFYYNSIVEGKKFESIKYACEEFNKFCDKASKKTNSSAKSYVSCYELLEDGSLDENRIFYMEVFFTKDKNGAKVCKIENTFTNTDYRGNGIHTCAIKFLEAVCSRKYIPSLIGESQACDIYEENGATTLENHYEKLGFRVITDKNGTNHIIKDIDEFNSMQISKTDIELEK